MPGLPKKPNNPAKIKGFGDFRALFPPYFPVWDALQGPWARSQAGDPGPGPRPGTLGPVPGWGLVKTPKNQAVRGSEAPCVSLSPRSAG